MKRFILATALALTALVATNNKSQAQIITAGFGTPNFGVYYGPSYNYGSYYSPYSYSYGSNYSYGYNYGTPYYGSSYYRPYYGSAFVGPRYYGGYNYNYGWRGGYRGWRR